ncbi:CynX/NimT family MFS transporter [Paraburkholderia humisilvae]|uniref:Putative transporter YycB n=1 Tax=Paraburkholderia humisilvae TaxID=627669 RepID=A0A6J5D6Z8_9BURK|nr:MFS transporter [Paraburkholderia humisilvae]CAB3749713.1 putative transporter YycB [Paraburkholderia humisilvae]
MTTQSDLAADATSVVSPASQPPDARARLLLAVGVIALALNLRPSIIAVSPMLNLIRHDTGMSTAVAGLLTTLPLLCFGLLAPIAPWLARRCGIESVLCATMVAVCVGTAIRDVPSMPALLGGTVVIGAGIAVANVLIPAIIKRDCGPDIGLMMGLYSMSLSIGAALAAGVTVPLARAAHTDWRTTLALWGWLAAAALVAWVPQLRRQRRRQPARTSPATQPVRGMWTHPVAWLVTAFMGLQSFGYYATTAYLPSILIDAGLSAGEAGWMLSLANLLGIVAAFVAPTLAVRAGRPGLLAVLVATLTASGLAGLIFAPASFAYGWILLLGLGQVAAFSLALLLIVLRTPDGRHAAQLSSMAQCCGYLLAAAGPLAIGAVRQASGGWSAPLVVLLILLVPQTVVGLGAARSRYAAPDSRISQN